MFDADARRAALEPPTLKMDGEVYPGRCLSFDDGAQFRADFEQLQSGQTDDAFLRALTERLFAAMQFPADLAAKVFATLPTALIIGMLVDFSGALLGLRSKETAPANPTSSSASSS